MTSLQHSFFLHCSSYRKMAARGRAVSLMRAMSGPSCRCPAHGGGLHVHKRPTFGATRTFAAETNDTDYAFEMACSNIRFGEGVTKV